MITIEELATDGRTTHPSMLLGYRTERQSRNIVHNVVGGGVAVTLLPSNPRSGRLTALYLDEATALTALDILGAAHQFRLTWTERPARNMTFTVDANSISAELDPTTGTRWRVEFGYQETP